MSLFRAFFFRSLLLNRRYFTDYLFGFFIKLLFFLAVLYQSGGEAAMVYGFLLWYLGAHLLSRMAGFFLEEAYLGTLPRLLASPHSPLALVFTLALSELLVSLFWVAGLGLAAFAYGARLFSLFPGALFTGVLVLVAVFGLGLILLAASLRFKQVASLAEVVNFYLLLFSGFFVPLADLPMLFDLLNVLNPFTHLVAGRTLGLAATSGFWLFAGIVSFQLSLALAKRRGDLLDY